MSTQKKTPKIVGLLGKTRDELSTTGPTAWFALFPGSRREGEEWIPDGTKPFRVLIVINRVKTWLTAGDIKALHQLFDENKEDIEAGFQLADLQTERQIQRLQESLEK